MTVEVPSDSSRTRKIVLAVLVALVGAGLLGLGIWAALNASDQRPPAQTEIEPAEQTSLPVDPQMPGLSESSTAESAPDATPPQNPAEKPAARKTPIAFVLGGRIHVADEDGSQAVSVAPRGGAHAVSPDGSTLAVVYSEQSMVGTSRTVTLFDTATGASRTIGTDVAVAQPAWSPDSSWLVFTTISDDTTTGLYRVPATGGTPTLVAESAAMPRVSADGAYIAYGPAEQMSGDEPVQVLAVGKKRAARVVTGSTGAVSWGWGPGPALYFTKPGADEASWELWEAKSPSFRGTRLGAVDLVAPAFAFGDVLPSPDGRYILLAAVGDDAYSRMWIADLVEGRFSQIETRRDAYPLSWGSDGRVLFFEGNTYQGESGVLASVLPDGTSRRLVVTGVEP